jgi:murein DD-endopeptidase MepM/ murein hydrolase activator NlpD
MSVHERGRIGVLLLLVTGLVAAGLGAVSLVRVGPPPEITIAPGLPAIGKTTPVTVRVAVPRRGLGDIRVELAQGEAVHRLAEKSFRAAPAWKIWDSGTPSAEIAVEVGKATVPGLKAGTATIRVTAERAGSLLRRPDPVVREVSLPVRLAPPSLQVLSTQTYVSQGGAEAVVYRVGESAVRSGVWAGDRFFPGFPLPGGSPQDRFALFGVPYDVGDATGIRLVAADEVGNEAVASFVDRFTPQAIRSETLEVTDAFLARVLPEILAQTEGLEDKGSPLENYLLVNGDLRRRNAAELVQLAARSAPSFLWRAPFRAMPNTKVMSGFADRRAYRYAGREVDRQVHLGFDLASTRGAPVPAANAGTVVLAGYFGIYGNTVIVDHGYGLMSLYGHLSSIDVAAGASVAAGAILGRSGQTGLAGGDHLHFSMLLHGVSVNPKEWWDGHWIRDRIARKLGAALPFEG